MSEAITWPVGLDLNTLVDWGSWGAEHYAQVPALLDAVRDVGEAESRPIAKWAAVKQVGDIVVPILDDSPLFRQRVFEGDLTERLHVESLRFGDGAVRRRFFELLPTIIQILTMLKPLLGA